jgi:magnesium transporter
MTLEKSDLKLDLLQHYFLNFPGEAAGVLNEIPIDEILLYLEKNPAPVSAEVLVKLDSNIISGVLTDMDNDLFSVIFALIDPYQAAIILSRLEPDLKEKRLMLIPDKLSNEIKEILTYPQGSAGFLMDTRILTFYPESSVEEVLIRLRMLKDRKIFSVSVVDRENKLVGRVPVQVLAISPPDEVLSNILERPVSIHVMSPQEEVVDLLKDGKIISLPVVDLDNHLLGVIRHDALIKATEMDATEDVQAIFGAGREERALSKVSLAIKKRLPWLEINLATAFLAASVVGIFEDTIARITVLAVFLPVVAGQSGNTGSQALAVTIRGLALREIRIGQWFKVAKKEFIVGIVNGIAVALTTSLIVYIWASSLGLALVIGISMVFSMAIAGLSGAVIPILLKAFGQDPAQSSSIVLTTVTDIVGFFSFLGLATILGTLLGFG